MSFDSNPKNEEKNYDEKAELKASNTHTHTHKTNE